MSSIVTAGAVESVGDQDDLRCITSSNRCFQGGDGYDLDNLEAICRGCHIEITSKDNRRELTPGEDAWHELVAEAVAATR